MGSRQTDAADARVVDTNLLIIFAITLMAIMGVSSITPVIPTVGEQFHVSPTRIGLLITVFTLPGVALTPLAGVLADRIGRKPLIVPSLMLFAAAGTLCAVSWSFPTLLVLRFLQGIGSAGIGSLNVTLIGDIYSGPRRTAAMGYNASVLSIGTASFPAIGGALALLGWRLPFALPILALGVGLLVLFLLDNPEPEGGQSLCRQLSGTAAAMAHPTVIGLLLASLLTFILLYGSFLTYIPILMRQRFEASPPVIGMIMSASSLSTAGVAWLYGRIAKRIAARLLVPMAFLLYATALVLVPHAQSVWGLMLPAIIFGLAQGINLPSIMTVLTATAPMAYRGAFMSTNGMLLRIGQTLGPVIMGAAFAGWGMGGPFLAGTLVALCSALLLLFLLRIGE